MSRAMLVARLARMYRVSGAVIYGRWSKYPSIRTHDVFSKILLSPTLTFTFAKYAKSIANGRILLKLRLSGPDLVGRKIRSCEDELYEQNRR